MRGELVVGVIGTGLMAEIYAAILAERPDCRVKAVVGNTEEKTRAFAEKFGLAAISGGDYARLYREHPDIDVTLVTTPEWVRLEPVEAAVAAGQHILLEKPFASSLADAEALKNVLSAHAGVVDVCHVLRHSSRFYALHKAVEAGRLGEIRHIFARRNSNNQRVKRVLGKTDLAYWLTPHDVDIMRWLTHSEITEVFARSRHGLADADDYLIANFRFRNGVDAVLEISWCAPPVSGTAREAIFEVRGTEGVAELEDFNMALRIFGENERVSAPDTYEDYEVHGARRGFFEAMLANFVAKVKRGDTSKEGVEDGYRSVRACHLIRRSLDEGRLVVDAG